jgi:hypothetical protein
MLRIVFLMIFNPNMLRLIEDLIGGKLGCFFMESNEKDLVLLLLLLINSQVFASIN